MLVEFSVENFLSIKEKVTLSMLASSGKENPDNLIELVDVPTLKGEKLLKSAAIYGANASGKTNFLKALEFVESIINNSHQYQIGKKLDINRFKLNASCLDKPSIFNIIFVKNNVKYEYGFALNEEKIIEEHLYYYPKGYKTRIFERNENNNFEFTQDIKEQEALSKRTSENKLYLSVAAQWNFEKIKQPYSEFTKFLNFIDHKGIKEFSAFNIKKDKKFKQIFLKYLKMADFDIKDIKIVNVFGEPRKISTYHLGIDHDNDKIPVEFDLKEESKGTQEYFNFLGYLLKVLEYGDIFVIDEIESSLHPSLVKNIIELFHNPEINKNNAQLIFTTHETNLLSLDLLRRDQIWFTERKDDKSTDLYCLDEFSPRLDENIQKGYLNGRYGAIPFLGDWSLLCPEE